jgi:hypothetical protein
MKLGEILLEQFDEAALKKLLDCFIIRFNHKDVENVDAFRKWLEPNSMKLKAEIKNMKMFAEHPSTELTWPFDKVVAPTFRLEALGDNEGDGIIVTNFKNLPHAREFDFGDVEIKSFEGVNENDKLVGLNFNNVKCQCGLLRLLKVKSLEKISVWGSADKNLAKAIGIIRKNLDEGRDLPDCMDELIEAGLKEYAKL